MGCIDLFIFPNPSLKLGRLVIGGKYLMARRLMLLLVLNLELIADREWLDLVMGCGGFASGRVCLDSRLVDWIE